MSQQINLFNPAFLKKKNHFSAVAMAQALGLVLLGCVAVGVYAHLQLTARERDVATTDALLVRIKERMHYVEIQFTPRESNPALDDDIKNARTDVDVLQHVVSDLEGGNIGNKQGYSGYFRGFARQIVDGLWLTGIDIVGAGREIGLQGRALKPDLIPIYLSRLKNEADMQGKSFAALAISTPQAGADVSKGADAGKGTADGGTAAASTGAANGKGSAPASGQPKPAGYVEFDLQSSEDAAAEAAARAK